MNWTNNRLGGDQLVQGGSKRGEQSVFLERRVSTSSQLWRRVSPWSFASILGRANALLGLRGITSRVETSSDSIHRDPVQWVVVNFA